MNSLYSTCHAILKNGLHRTYPNHRIGDRNGTRARTKRSTLDIPMELSAEISNNLIESAWAYDLSARTTIRSVTMVLEVSHIPRTSGCWVNCTMISLPWDIAEWSPGKAPSDPETL